jgi:hypothetical protein
MQRSDHGQRIKRGRFGCVDCRKDTNKSGEYYMVRDEVWAASGITPHGGMLCLRCLERRIGREINIEDFTAQCPTLKAWNKHVAARPDRARRNRDPRGPIDPAGSSPEPLPLTPRKPLGNPPEPGRTSAKPTLIELQADLMESVTVTDGLALHPESFWPGPVRESSWPSRSPAGLPFWGGPCKNEPPPRPVKA